MQLSPSRKQSPRRCAWAWTLLTARATLLAAAGLRLGRRGCRLAGGAAVGGGRGHADGDADGRGQQAGRADLAAHRRHGDERRCDVDALRGRQTCCQSRDATRENISRLGERPGTLACAGASMQQGPKLGRLHIKELTLGRFCMSGQLVNRHKSIYLGLNLADMQETQVGMYLGLDVLAGSADVDNGRQHLCRQPSHDNHSSRAAMIVQPGMHFCGMRSSPAYMQRTGS